MAARRRTPGARESKIAFTVWQFVRLMVRLEETARASGSRPRDQLYREWRGAWDEVDRELTRLGKDDPDGFADLLMDHDVVMSCEPGGQFNQVVQVIDEVIAQLSTAIAAKEGGAEQLRHFKFERNELDKLRKRIVPQPRRRKSS